MWAWGVTLIKFSLKLMYRIDSGQLCQRTLQVMVWSYDSLKENEFLGAVHIKLGDIDLTKENIAWFKLQTLHILGSF